MSQPRFFDEDSELAQKASHGDRAAFGALIEKYQGPIYGYAMSFFRHPERAEDVTQDTFLRAFRFLHTYDPSRRFSTWLYTIARNLCIDRLRDDQRREVLVGTGTVPEAAEGQPGALEILEGREERARLLVAIQGLPEKYRTPILLYHSQGLPYQQISDILGISLNNTKIRIFRAKKQLLRALGLDEGEP